MATFYPPTILARLNRVKQVDASWRWVTVNDGVMGGRSTGGPSVEELAGPVRTRRREVPANGTEALIAEIRSLRSQADGNALAAINLAVEQVLTDDELAARSGGR